MKFSKISYDSISKLHDIYKISRIDKSELSIAQMKIFSFLTFCCLNHPDLLTSIASCTDLDTIILFVFESNLQNDQIVNPETSFYLPVLQFLASVSQSSIISIT